MSLPNARQGCNYQFPLMTISAVDINGDPVSLTGQEVLIEFSTPYRSEPAWVLSSTTSPRPNQWVIWDTGTGELDVMLSATGLDNNLPPGQWSIVIKLTNDEEDADDLIVQTNVKDMTLALTVEKWPAVIVAP